MKARRVWRAACLARALAACMVRLSLRRLRGPLSPVERALWLQSACRGVLRSLDLTYAVRGKVPPHGLVVSNHLSYLDIVFYSAAMPCFFVSKAEVKRWPYFGAAASAGGTIFLDRTSRGSASEVAQEMAGRLTLPVPLLLFPEGTSTDGSRVRRFHSGLFQSAIDAAAPVVAAAVRYVPGDGAAESKLCWFGDDGFSGHLWRTLGAPPFQAEIMFGNSQVYADRRTASDATHELIAGMREAKALSLEASQIIEDLPARTSG